MSDVDDLAAVIEADMLANYGGEENVSSDPASYIRAKIYAQSIEFANLELSSRAAGNQFDPTQATDLLPKLEWEYALLPKATDDLATRRAAVAVAAKLSGGAKRSNVEAVLTALLGADFLAYITQPRSSLAYALEPEEAHGNFVRAGTPGFVGRLVGHVLSGARTVTYERVGGRDAPPRIGETLIIEPGFTRPDPVVVTEAIGDSFVATLARAHATGTLFTTGRCICLPSVMRDNLVVVTSTVARDPEKRRQIDLVLRKLFRGTSTWTVVESSATGQAGPFILGQSLMGVVPIKTVIYNTLTTTTGATAGANANLTAFVAATSRALKASAASSSPTITVGATRGNPLASSSPTITAAATSSAKKASQGQGTATVTGAATSHAIKKSQGVSSPTITVGAIGRAV
jgi:hypothetical protein